MGFPASSLSAENYLGNAAHEFTVKYEVDLLTED